MDTPDKDQPPCPLCMGTETGLFHEDRARAYFKCARCALVFVPSVYHLDPVEEKQRYDQHENDPAEPGYRAFLARLVKPLAATLAPGAAGLDFGSGPEPALAVMFTELGFSMQHYDPFYAADTRVLETTYDFIACSEVVEHFSNPGAEWERVVRLVRPGGRIGVMTSLLDDVAKFPNWHYKRDETHVSFYSKETFDWLAQRYSLKVEFSSDSVMIFRVRHDRDCAPSAGDPAYPPRKDS